jgi:hypothetical protein
MCLAASTTEVRGLVVHLKEARSRLWVLGLDVPDRGVAFARGARAHAYVGAVLGEVGYRVVSARFDCQLGRIECWEKGTYMPEVPPVTMYTVPVRSEEAEPTECQGIPYELDPGM